jgi:arginine utilization protein RocB
VGGEGMHHWNSKEGILELLYRLVKVPSVTGTRGELRMEEEIAAILEEMPYFQENPHLIYRKEIAGDVLNRKAIAGLYKGKETSQKTILLLSHYDVVGVEDYGRLAPLAFSPLECTSAMVEENIPDDANQDLKSGEWIF